MRPTLSELFVQLSGTCIKIALLCRWRHVEELASVNPLFRYADITGQSLPEIQNPNWRRTTLSRLLRSVIKTLAGAGEIGIVARERGRLLLEDEERSHFFVHFRWYRLGGLL